MQGGGGGGAGGGPVGSGGAGGSGGTVFGAGGGDGGTASCPDPVAADPIIATKDPAVRASGPGTLANGQCCYPVFRDCSGRPFLVGERAVAAPARRAGDARPGESALSPRLGELSLELRARLAEEWTRDGLFEHASIASFGRFALELMAAGAPLELVADAHRAALDEVRHARLCLELAGAYAGERLEPGRFPAGDRVPLGGDLASIAAHAAREGCIGETIAAIRAAEQLSMAIDPAVRAALAIIVEDEARHAELAWRTVRWAVEEGGAPVCAAAAAVFAELDAPWPEPAEGVSDARLAAHGRLDPRAARACAMRAIDEVVRPCAVALLAAA